MFGRAFRRRWAMSDIVERLRLRRDPLTDGERAEAADEIERLRARLKWFEDAGGVAVTTRVHQQHAEIERLRNLLIAAGNVTTDAAKEIERLRGENNVLASLLTCWLNPMLQGEDRWAISAETLEQLLKATKKALGDDPVRQSNNPPT
jgi:hypothetical protein